MDIIIAAIFIIALYVAFWYWLTTTIGDAINMPWKLVLAIFIFLPPLGMLLLVLSLGGIDVGFLIGRLPKTKTKVK